MLKIHTIRLALASCVFAGLLLPAFSADSRPAISIEIESIAKFQEDVRTAAKALDIPMEDDKDMALALLAPFTPSEQELVGIATNRPLSVHIFLPKPPAPGAAPSPADPKPIVVMVLPVVQQGKPYLEFLKSTFPDVENVKNLHVFNGGGDDATGYSALALGDRIIAGPDTRSVRLVADLVMRNPGPAVVQSATGTFRIQLNMPVLVKTIEGFLPMINQMASGQFKTTPTPGDDDVPKDAPSAPTAAQPDPAKLLLSEEKILLTVLRQVERLSIGLAARPKTIDVLVKTEYTPGSTLAGALGTLHPPTDKFMTCLPSNTVFAIAGGNLTFMDALNAPLAEFVEDYYNALGPQGKSLGALMKKNITDSKGLYTGNYAAGLFKHPTSGKMGFVQILEVKDPAKARRIQEESLKNWNANSPTTPGMALLVKPPRTYKNAQILTSVLSVTNAASPFPGAPGLPTPVWLNNLQMEVAFLGNCSICVVGGSNITDAAIDRMNSAGPRLDKSRVFTAIFPTMRYQPVSLWTFSPLSFVKRVLELAAGENAAPFIKAIPESPAGMAGFTVKEGTTETSYTRVSLDEVAAIRKASQQIGAAFMQSMAGIAAGIDTPPSSPKAQCVNNLRLLDHAKEVHAIKQNLADGASIAEDKLLPYLPDQKMPVCPEAGHYTLNPIGQNPTCSAAGHAL